MTHDIFTADSIFTGGALRAGYGLSVADGLIVRVGPVETLLAPDTRHVTRFDGRVLLPGAVNSHSHAFQIGIRGTADNAPGFREWVDRHLYPLVLAVDEEAARALCRLAFSAMVQCGATTVGEFWYIHNAPVTCEPLENTYCEIAIQAAREVGIRIHLLRALYDQGKKEGQKRFQEPVSRAVDAVRALHARHRDDPLVSVAPAPHSLHGASPEMIRAGADLAREMRTRWHIHLAEEAHDIPYARQHHGTTPLRALEQLGVLGPDCVVVHGVWLDAEEIRTLGRVGGGLAYNPISNAALGDGITDIEAMVRAGVTVSLGTDGACANNGVDVWREMRVTEQLQRLQKLRMGVLPPLAPPGTPNLPLEMGTAAGGRNLGLPVGRLEPGHAADFVALDYEDLSLQPNHGLDTVPFLNNVVNAMEIRSALTDVVVAGRPILKDRQLMTVDARNVGIEAQKAVRRLMAAGRP